MDQSYKYCVCNKNEINNVCECPHKDQQTEMGWANNRILHFVYTVHFPHLPVTWWRHQMETFSALLAICAGNSPVPGEFPTQRPVTRSFDIFFDLCLNKRLSKQWWGWWFETLSSSLWRHRNVYFPQTSLKTPQSSPSPSSACKLPSIL